MPLPKHIQDLVDRQIITNERASRLGNYECKVLKSKAVHRLITDDTLPFDQFVKLNHHGFEALKLKAVPKLLTDGDMPSGILLELDSFGYEALKSKAVRRLLTDHVLTPDQFAGLIDNGYRALELKGVRRLLTDHVLTSDQFSELHCYGYEALKSKGVRRLLTDRVLTPDQFAGLIDDGYRALRLEAVRRLLTDRVLTPDQFAGLSDDGYRALRLEGARRLLADGTLPFNQFAELSNQRYGVLSLAGVQELLADRTITFNQALGLNYNTLVALKEPETRRRLRDGELTFQELIGGPADAEHKEINDAQSIHTVLVHGSMSDGTTRHDGGDRISMPKSSYSDSSHEVEPLKKEILRFTGDVIKGLSSITAYSAEGKNKRDILEKLRDEVNKPDLETEKQLIDLFQKFMGVVLQRTTGYGLFQRNMTDSGKEARKLINSGQHDDIKCLIRTIARPLSDGAPLKYREIRSFVLNEQHEKSKFNENEEKFSASNRTHNLSQFTIFQQDGDIEEELDIKNFTPQWGSQP